MSGAASELELFVAIDRGDVRALADLRDRLRRCVHWVLNRMTTNRGLEGEVDEIVDDAHLRLEELRKRGFNGGPREFRSYLYKVVASACCDARDRRRWIQLLDEPVTLADGDEQPLMKVTEALTTAALADEAVVRSDEARTVREALARLDPRCRRLLEQFHLKDASIAELARQENVRPNTVEVALSRCRTRLYASFLSLYVAGGDPAWRARVTAAALALSPPLAKIFTTWWTENRSVTDISKEMGIASDEGKRLLAHAKVEVWRILSGEGVS